MCERLTDRKKASSVSVATGKQMSLFPVDVETFPTESCGVCGRTGWYVRNDGPVCIQCSRPQRATILAKLTRCRTAKQMVGE